MHALSAWLNAVLGGRRTGGRRIRVRVWHALALWLLLGVVGWHMVAVALMYLL